MKDRLTRLDRIYEEAPIFFITCCTPKRQKILASNSIHQSFQDFCQSARERHILVGRYVIMPDHLHFFVHLAEPTGLPIWIKSLKNSLSKTLRENGKMAPHWQKGYFDHLLRSNESHEEKWLYVWLNPVRKGLVKEACEWPFQGEISSLDLA
jgi:putative transposase